MNGGNKAGEVKEWKEGKLGREGGGSKMYGKGSKAGEGMEGRNIGE